MFELIYSKFDTKTWFICWYYHLVKLPLTFLALPNTWANCWLYWPTYKPLVFVTLSLYSQSTKDFGMSIMLSVDIWPKHRGYNVYRSHKKNSTWKLREINHIKIPMFFFPWKMCHLKYVCKQQTLSNVKWQWVWKGQRNNITHHVPWLFTCFQWYLREPQSF